MRFFHAEVNGNARFVLIADGIRSDKPERPSSLKAEGVPCAEDIIFHRGGTRSDKSPRRGAITLPCLEGIAVEMQVVGSAFNLYNISERVAGLRIGNYRHRLSIIDLHGSPLLCRVSAGISIVAYQRILAVRNDRACVRPPIPGDRVHARPY